MLCNNEVCYSEKLGLQNTIDRKNEEIDRIRRNLRKAEEDLAEANNEIARLTLLYSFARSLIFRCLVRRAYIPGYLYISRIRKKKENSCHVMLYVVTLLSFFLSSFSFFHISETILFILRCRINILILRK